MSAASPAPRAVARRIECDLAIIDKRRERAGVSEVMNVIGDVKGQRCLLIDDLVDSGGTLCNAAEALMATVPPGSRPTAPMACSPVRRSSGSSARRWRSWSSPISIAATEAVRGARNIRQLPIAHLVAEAMRRISEERSVSSLFD